MADDPRQEMREAAEAAKLLNEGSGLEELEQGAQPTSPKAWGRRGPNTTPLRLPSGNVMLVRKPNLAAMMARADIPNPLLPAIGVEDARLDLAARAEASGRTIVEQREHEQEHPEEVDEDTLPDGELTLQQRMRRRHRETALYNDLIVWAACVEPRISYEPPVEPGGSFDRNGHLVAEALDEEDRSAILAWAVGQFDMVTPFRANGAGADGGAARGEVRDETEQPAGDPGDGGDGVAPVLPGRDAGDPVDEAGQAAKARPRGGARTGARKRP